MILEAVKYVNEILQLQSIAALVPGQPNWMLAEHNTKPPFVNFMIKNEGRASKDMIGQYSVNIVVTGLSLTNSAQLADGIEQAIEASDYNRLRFRGNEIQYNDTEAKEASCIITYEFKF